MNIGLIKFLKIAALLVVVIFLCDFLISRIFDFAYFRNAENGPKTLYSIEVANADVIIFGSSRASHHYIPSIIEDATGMSCYNAGLDGRNIFYHKAILKVMLSKFTPKVIILDITSSDFAGDGMKEDFKGLSILNPFYPKYKELIKESLYLQSSFEKYKLVSGLYRYNSKLDDVFLSYYNGGVGVTKLKGFEPLSGVWNLPIESQTLSKVVSLDSLKFKYLEEFVELAKEKGSKVYFIVSPFYKFYDDEKDYSFLSDNLPIDGLWSLEQDSSFLQKHEYFKDPSHLNKTGAAVFTRKIATSLFKNKYKTTE